MIEDAKMDAITEWLKLGTGLPGDKVVWSMQGVAWPDAPWLSVNLLATSGVGLDESRYARNPLTLPDHVVATVDAAADALDFATPHAFVNLDGPVYVETTDTPPTPLVVGDPYFVIVVDADTVRLAASIDDAVAGTFIPLDDAGIGTHRIVTAADSLRANQSARHTIEGMRRAVLSLQYFSVDAIGPSRAQGELERLRVRANRHDMRDVLAEVGLYVATIGPATVVGGSQSTASDFEPRAVCEVTLHYVDTDEELLSSIDRVEGDLDVGGPAVPFTVTLEP